MRSLNVVLVGDIDDAPRAVARELLRLVHGSGEQHGGPRAGHHRRRRRQRGLTRGRGRCRLARGLAGGRERQRRARNGLRRRQQLLARESEPRRHVRGADVYRGGRIELDDDRRIRLGYVAGDVQVEDARVRAAALAPAMPADRSSVLAVHVQVSLLRRRIKVTSCNQKQGIVRTSE